MGKNTCCFLGHRTIETTDKLRKKLYTTIEKLIVEEKIDTFLFGSKSQFDELCYQIVSMLKENYPFIKRIYVRAEFPHINNDYESYLLQHYEDTYYPNHIQKAGKSAYIERNCEMINKSICCIMYYNENYAPPKRKQSNKDLTYYQPKSGTKIAYHYALRKQKTIINIFKDIK